MWEHKPVKKMNSFSCLGSNISKKAREQLQAFPKEHRLGQCSYRVSGNINFVIITERIPG